VRNGRATFTFSDAYGNPVTHLTFAFTPDAQITVDGRPTMVSSLKECDEITLWVPEHRFGFYAQPRAGENKRFRLVSSQSGTGQKR
jgi:hypothetical protein